MTPNDLEVLIHYYVSPEKHPRSETPGIIRSIAEFLNDGIFKKTDSASGITVTEKGKAWLEIILETPCPVMKWVDSRKAVPNKRTA